MPPVAGNQCSIHQQKCTFVTEIIFFCKEHNVLTLPNKVFIPHCCYKLRIENYINIYIKFNKYILSK